MKNMINNTPAARMLDLLTADVDFGTPKKIANSETYMAVHVEKVGENLYSVAHYYEQNGDLMSDPEMVFLHVAPGLWQPVSITQHGVGVYREAIVFEDGKIVGYRPRLLDELCSFTTIWMRNIKAQQGLRLARPVKAA